MARRGWGTGAWGNFKWGGAEDTGPSYSYSGNVPLALANSAIDNFHICIEGSLPLSALSGYTLCIVPYITGGAIDLLNSIVYVPCYWGRQTIAITPSHVFTCDVYPDVDTLDLKLLNSAHRAICPVSDLDISLLNSGLSAIAPVLAGLGLALLNSHTLFFSYDPNVGLTVTLLNSASKAIEAKPSTSASVEFIPSADVFGWQCDEKSRDTTFTTPTKGSTNWTGGSRGTTDYNSTSRGSSSWSSTSKRGTQYAEV